MNTLTEAEDTLLIRTDFTDQQAWEALLAAIDTPNEDDFKAYVQVVDDPQYTGATAGQLAALSEEKDVLLIVADRTALSTPEMQLLAVMVHDEDEEEDFSELRVAAEHLWSIENNLSISNMDWEDFTDSADDDGVFRGF